MARPFKKLPKKTQEAVLERYRYFNVEDFEWWDSTEEVFKEDMKEKGVEVDNIYFEMFCQGAGACYVGSFNVLKLIEANLEPLVRGGIDIFMIRKILDGCWSSGIINHKNRYYYKETMDISMEVEYPEEADETETEKADKLIKETVEEFLKDEAGRLYKMLETEHDYLTSDDAVKETLIANDYLFDREGVMV